MNLNSLRTNEALSGNTEPLVWGSREVLDYAEVVLNRDDIDAKADAFIDFLAERVVGREYVDEMLRGKSFHVQSFADLDEFFRAIFDFMEAMGRGSEVWRTHHVHDTQGSKPLSNISTRQRVWSPTTVSPTTCPGAASRIAVHTSWIVAGLDRWLRIWSSLA